MLSVAGGTMYPAIGILLVGVFPNILVVDGDRSGCDEYMVSVEQENFFEHHNIMLRCS